MEWFIQLHKKICDWEWYTHIPTKVLFFHILLKCNFKEAKWRGKVVKPWEFITSIEHLSLETWLSRQQIRTAIQKLKETGEITHYSTNEYTTLALNNWESYNTPDNKRITNEQQTNNKRITTTNKNNKEYKENKEYNTEIVATQPNEYQLSISYLKNINIDTLHNSDPPDYASDYKKYWIEFVLYWTEKSNNWKIRAEWQKTFEIKRRFYTWLKVAKVNYEKNTSSALDITL